MKINQNVKFLTSYNTKIFKISAGFSSKLKPHNSLNLALCLACLYEHFCASQLYVKKPRENQNIDLFDHFYEAILCDSHYVFIVLARGVLVLNFAFLRRFLFFFDFCYKTLAGIKIRRLHVTFLGLVPVGSEIEFRRRSDLQVAQNEFVQNCRNSTNINENQAKCQALDFL